MTVGGVAGADRHVAVQVRVRRPHGIGHRLGPGVRQVVEMESQSAKFLAMLSEVVSVVRNPEAFRATLIWALAQTTPVLLSDDARRDWIEAYTLMAHVMRTGAVRP